MTTLDPWHKYSVDLSESRESWLHPSPILFTVPGFTLNTIFQWDSTNHKPISILPIFSKILEKLMYQHLYSFIEHQQILYGYQFGFREKYGTNLALMKIID